MCLIVWCKSVIDELVHHVLHTIQFLQIWCFVFPQMEWGLCSSWCLIWVAILEDIAMVMSWSRFLEHNIQDIWKENNILYIYLYFYRYTYLNSIYLYVCLYFDQNTIKEFFFSLGEIKIKKHLYKTWSKSL